MNYYWIILPCLCIIQCILGSAGTALKNKCEQGIPECASCRTNEKVLRALGISFTGDICTSKCEKCAWSAGTFSAIAASVLYCISCCVCLYAGATGKLVGDGGGR